ncbi:hypothetical protein KBC75_05290 [Candidatus Shapirobacteria bacterium]|nr:hypothetical protein [Candidatus Shapirobacteria bacterium]
MKVSTSLRCLFTSVTRQKLITTFFYNPAELFYVRQLVRSSEEEINSVRRELLNLKSANLVLSETRGNRLYYWANPEHVLFFQLQILANQSAGLGKNIIDQKSKIGTIKLLVYSQQFLNHQPSNGIDLILVGEASLRIVDEIIKTEETVRGREINYMVMDKNEFRLRRVKRDPVLVDFFLNCPAVIIGQPNELG